MPDVDAGRQQRADHAIDPAELAEHWSQITTPLGVEWSGRARYAAAMFFFQHGQMSAEALEIYRICSRLDAEDPLAIMRDRSIGNSWLTRLAAHESDPAPGRT